MSELHVRQIRAALTQHFDGLIDMSDYEAKPAAERESAFLSRAQGAFVLPTSRAGRRLNSLHRLLPAAKITARMRMQ